MDKKVTGIDLDELRRAREEMMADMGIIPSDAQNYEQKSSDNSYNPSSHESIDSNIEQSNIETESEKDYDDEDDELLSLMDEFLRDVDSEEDDEEYLDEVDEEYADLAKEINNLIEEDSSDTQLNNIQTQQETKNEVQTSLKSKASPRKNVNLAHYDVFSQFEINSAGDVGEITGNSMAVENSQETSPDMIRLETDMISDEDGFILADSDVDELAEDISPKENDSHKVPSRPVQEEPSYQIQETTEEFEEDDEEFEVLNSNKNVSIDDPNITEEDLMTKLDYIENFEKKFKDFENSELYKAIQDTNLQDDDQDKQIQENEEVEESETLSEETETLSEDTETSLDDFDIEELLTATIEEDEEPILEEISEDVNTNEDIIQEEAQEEAQEEVQQEEIKEEPQKIVVNVISHEDEEKQRFLREETERLILENAKLNATYEKLKTKDFLTEINPANFVNILSMQDFKNSDEFTFVLGKSESGNIIFENLKKCYNIAMFANQNSYELLNCMLLSFMLKNSATDFKIALCDGNNSNNFAYYENIKYLYNKEIAKDEDKIAQTLTNIVAELESRYHTLARVNVKSIDEFNMLAKNTNTPKLPQIFVVIDGYFELMHSQNFEKIKSCLYQILRLGRIAGIYAMVISSTKIEEDIINFNLPARIAFKCSENDDSIAMIGEMGVDRLANNHEFLYSNINLEKAEHIRQPVISDAIIKILIDNIEK